MVEIPKTTEVHDRPDPSAFFQPRSNPGRPATVWIIWAIQATIDGLHPGTPAAPPWGISTIQQHPTPAKKPAGILRKLGTPRSSFNAARSPPPTPTSIAFPLNTRLTTPASQCQHSLRLPSCNTSRAHRSSPGQPCPRAAEPRTHIQPSPLLDNRHGKKSSSRSL